MHTHIQVLRLKKKKTKKNHLTISWKKCDFLQQETANNLSCYIKFSKDAHNIITSVAMLFDFIT